MPRKWIEKVQGWPALKAGHDYEVRIALVEKSAQPLGLRVQFEFVAGEQAGRTHAAVLPLPIRPAGLTAEFFLAAGISVMAGGTIMPKTAVGKVVRAQFAPGASDEESQIRRFTPAKES